MIRPRAPRWIKSLLAACGVDPAQPWGELLASLLFVSPDRGIPLVARLKALFPHVDFARLKLDDLIRVPLQLLWLALIKPAPPKVKRDPWRKRFKNQAIKVATRLAGLIPKPLMRRCLIPTWERGIGLATDFRTRWLPRIKQAEKKGEEYVEHWLWDHPHVRHAAFILSGILTALCITTPFNTLAQVVYITLLLGIALVIRRFPGHTVTLMLILLSITNSTRYLWWRMSYTLNWDESFDLIWGFLLLAAEIYTWVVLLFSFMQTAWPLKRSPVPLPDDPALWPSVDVYIPTYNESLTVVKPTVFAAMGMDWPEDKLNVYLLDDGRREVFRQFAEDNGVNYIIRPDNNHAKAGNLNHALTKTSGEYIAIFDCDHIPARSFLQLTMGWFLREKQLALVQTPHHFFSPDPFERNLGVFQRVPNEGELFYGLIQDGNDLWNATFFCGSCAVIRRKPLLEVGGIAVETVTEDAHTSLKLHRRGYTSAYINIPQASGLATESLSIHIGQRIRWARGMTQIFRLDNPLFRRGLRWGQRVCYSSAMMAFLGGVPKLVFLTAPLAFLLFHAYIIYASAVTVALYVLPHMMHVSIANSRIQGKFRHSFWGEVYETVLAWYIAIPTTMALLRPGKGTFNVTSKGGLVAEEFFDWTISLPYVSLALINLLGFCVGIGRIFWGEPNEIATVVLNLFWTLYNIIILGAAVAVAAEARQIRRSHRVNLRIPAVLRLPDGKLIHCHSEDFSAGGMSIIPDAMPNLRTDDEVSLLLHRADQEFAFPARVVSANAPRVRLQWQLTSRQQEAALVQCTFARADAWVLDEQEESHDHPLEGLREVIAMGITGYLRLAEHAAPRFLPFVHGISRLRVRLAGLMPRTPTAALVE